MARQGQLLFRNRAQGRHATAQVSPYPISTRQKAVDARLVLGRRPNPSEPLYYPKIQAREAFEYRRQKSLKNRRVPNKNMNEMVDRVFTLCQQRLLQGPLASRQSEVRSILQKPSVISAVRSSIVRHLSDYLTHKNLEAFDEQALGDWISIEEAFVKWIDADEEYGRASKINSFGPSKTDTERVRRIYKYLKQIQAIEPQDIRQGVVLSDSDASQAYFLLRKYRRQLESVGVSIDKVIPPLSKEESELAEKELGDESREVVALMELAQGEQLRQPTRKDPKDAYSLSSRLSGLKNEKSQLIEIFNQTLFEQGTKIAKVYGSRAESLFSREKLASKANVSNLSIVPVVFSTSMNGFTSSAKDYEKEVFYVGNVYAFSGASEIEDAQVAFDKDYVGAAKVDLDTKIVGNEKMVKYDNRKGYNLEHIQGYYPLKWFEIERTKDREKDDYRRKIPSILANKMYNPTDKSAAVTEEITEHYSRVIQQIAAYTAPRLVRPLVGPYTNEIAFVLPPAQLAAELSQTLQAQGQPPFYMEDYAILPEAAKVAASRMMHDMNNCFMAREGDVFVIAGRTWGGDYITDMEVLIVEKNMADPLHVRTLYKEALLETLSSLPSKYGDVLDSQGNLKNSIFLDIMRNPEAHRALVSKLIGLSDALGRTLRKKGLFTAPSAKNDEALLQIVSSRVVKNYPDEPFFSLPLAIEKLFPNIPPKIAFQAFYPKEWEQWEERYMPIVADYMYNFPAYTGLGVRSVYSWKLFETHDWNQQIRGYTVKQSTMDENFHLSAEDLHKLKTHPAFSSPIFQARITPEKLSTVPNNYPMLHLFLLLEKLGLPIENTSSQKAKKAIKKTAAKSATERKKSII